MKIKIGENEYRLPVTIDSCEETYTCISDENCKEVSKNDIVLALNELAQLRADRDGLKARVEELENTIDCGCNALTDSICCSGNDADTNLGFVRKMKRVLIGNNPTTPGGDDGK